jgi:hypothetical protein
MESSLTEGLHPATTSSPNAMKRIEMLSNVKCVLMKGPKTVKSESAQLWMRMLTLEFFPGGGGPENLHTDLV